MAESSRTTAGKRLAQQAGYFIREHSEQKFSLAGIAAALYVNGNYLARVFKRETGRTLLWYHNAVRCEKAKHLLLETELSVSEVGEEGLQESQGRDDAAQTASARRGSGEAS